MLVRWLLGSGIYDEFVARKPTSHPDGIVLQVGFNAIAEALGLAAVKAVVAITGIIAGGRLVCTVVSVQME